MSDSLADWLDLREPYDAAARSADLTRAVADALPHVAVVNAIDLGTGKGSNVRYLAGRLARPQHWLLVDRDAALLADLPRAMSGVLDASCSFETREQALGTLDPALFEGRQLVTASALLDLVSERWLRSLAACCKANAAVALFTLTYNGRSACSPLDPQDEVIRDLMNRHQRANDKGFGRAAGPDAVEATARSFSELGFRVLRAASDWVLPTDARELQRQLVDGWAEAATEIAPDESVMIQEWLRRRRAHIDAGRSRIIVCHEDLAAFP